MAKKVVIVATSADKMGEHTTGAWSEEITGPFYVFKEKGYDVSIVSVKGGKIPIDAGSLSDGMITDNDKRFEKDGDISKLEGTAALSTVKTDDFDAIFFAGGHGTVVDFPDACADIVTEAYAKGKIVAAVCHGPTALYKAKDGDAPLLKGKKCAGFTDEEEKAVGLYDKVDFTPEAKLKELGGEYSSAAAWASHAVRDGKLITGQNPGSSVAAANLVVEALS